MLVRKLWSLRPSTAEASAQNPARALYDAMRMSNEYKTCAAKYAKWACSVDGRQLSLLDESLKRLVTDLLTYESHQYLGVFEGKIHYSDGSDKSSDNIVVGYKTMFAYFKEHSRGMVTDVVLADQLCLLVNSGRFSYAELPHLYSHVLGVTGTLDTLRDHQQAILTNDYKVRKKTFIPSVYGVSKLTPTLQDLQIFPREEWAGKVVDEIGRRLVGSVVARAVLVFFKSPEDLDAFRMSDECKRSSAFSYKDIQLFTEATPMEDRAVALLRAVTPGTVTFLTKEIGRGTDFKCDKDLNASGGE